MNRVGGTFVATAADLYFCIGFFPDWVHIRNTATSGDYQIYWNKNMMRSAEYVEGIQEHTGSTYRQITALTKGAGILPFYGGTTLAAADVGTTTYGSADNIYIKPDNLDYRLHADTSPHGVGDAVVTDITAWELGSASNYTGNLNQKATGTYIGEGSLIQIAGRRYSIVAFTAEGETANQLTLSHNVASGPIEFIGGMYSMKSMTAGEVTKDGFLLGNDTVNATGILCYFEAGKYDW